MATQAPSTSLRARVAHADHVIPGSFTLRPSDGGAALTDRQRARATRAMAGMSNPATRIEVRPADSDTGWGRRVAMFLATAAVVSAAMVPNVAEARRAPANNAAAAGARLVVPPAIASLAQQIMARAGPSAVDRASDSSSSAEWTPRLPEVSVRVLGKDFPAMHPLDRVRLCQVVAARENLPAVGRDWRDVYAVISAETAWAPREGRGNNGKASYGLAQLEMATARALQIDDPADPLQAATATARLIRESVAWARVKRVEAQEAVISVHYNLSTAARNAWDGKTIDTLPVETQRHVANFLAGRRDAEFFGRQRAQLDVALQREALTMHAAETVRTAQVSVPKALIQTANPAGPTGNTALQAVSARAVAALTVRGAAATPGLASGGALFEMGRDGLNALSSRVSELGQRARDKGVPLIAEVQHLAFWEQAKARLVVALRSDWLGGHGLGIAQQLQGTHSESDRASTAARDESGNGAPYLVASRMRPGF